MGRHERGLYGGRTSGSNAAKGAAKLGGRLDGGIDIADAAGGLVHALLEVAQLLLAGAVGHGGGEGVGCRSAFEKVRAMTKF